MDVVTNIQKDLDSDKFSAGLFIHFKRALEMVDHEIPMFKLEKAGIRGPALDWFRNYLGD